MRISIGPKTRRGGSSPHLRSHKAPIIIFHFQPSVVRQKAASRAHKIATTRDRMETGASAIFKFMIITLSLNQAYLSDYARS